MADLDFAQDRAKQAWRSIGASLRSEASLDGCGSSRIRMRWIVHAQSKRTAPDGKNLDDAGSIPLLFAAALIRLIGCVGGAVDYGRSIVDRTRLNNALDSAAIVGAQAAASADSKGLTAAAVLDAARIAALASFKATPKLNADVNPTFTASVTNRSVSVTGDYTATTVLKALGNGTFPLATEQVPRMTFGHGADLDQSLNRPTQARSPSGQAR